MSVVEAPALRVLHRGPHHIVVDKPADTLVVHGRGQQRATLLDLVETHLGHPARPVHRLDRVTTGCCIFATTPFGEQALSDAFRRRLVEKRYLAVVEGRPEFKKLSIDARLLRKDAKDEKPPPSHKGAMAWQEIADAGQRALTHVRVLGGDDNQSVVLCHPITGRMHQIRAHLAHVGHPIVGDGRYGATTLGFAVQHIALHAFLLGVPRPDSGWVHAVAPPPPAMEERIDALEPARRRVKEAVAVFLEKAAAAAEKAKARSQEKRKAAPASRPSRPHSKPPKKRVNRGKRRGSSS